MNVTTEETKKSAKWKVGLAAGAAAALTLTGLSAASAADLHVDPESIAHYEIGNEDSADWNYNEWHLGLSEAEAAGGQLDDFVAFNECSIELGAHPAAGSWVDVLKGFDVDARPTANAENGLTEFEDLVDSVSIEVVGGSVTLQIPVFVFDALDAEPREPVDFTTIRSVVLEEGQHNLADLSIDNSQWDWMSFATWGELFDILAGDIEDDWYFEILGVGFNGNEGAEVASISFAGDTYYFGSGDCSPVIDDEDDEDEGDVEEEDDTEEDDEIDGPRKPERIETGR